MLCMNTTLNLDKDLLNQALKLHPDKTKKAIVEMGLRELILASERRELARLFGSQKNLVSPRRVRK